MASINVENIAVSIDFEEELDLNTINDELENTRIRYAQDEEEEIINIACDIDGSHFVFFKRGKIICSGNKTITKGKENLSNLLIDLELIEVD